MERFLKLFGKENIAYLTADREFKGKQWTGFLLEQDSRIRIPNNIQANHRHNTQTVTTRWLSIRHQELMLLNQPCLMYRLYVGAIRNPTE